MRRRKRVLSGMRPTGQLHIGHYFGALANWIQMQEEYDCFYFVADWHALTTDYADTSEVAQNTLEIATDWLAAGLDPAKCTMFVQSQVPEHAELHLLLSMVTPLSWLERVPTYKEQLEQITDKDLHTYGFLGYPLLQSADIVIYDADLVPVGEDQVPHVELTREIARRFNAAYGRVRWEKLPRKKILALFATPAALAGGAEKGTVVEVLQARGVLGKDLASEVEAHAWLDELLYGLTLDERLSRLANAGVALRPTLREPQVLLTETPRLPGTDGRKMSKSYNNFILLSEEPELIREKVRGMMTDPQRVRRQNPGRPEVCPVFAYHKLFSNDDTIAAVDRDCRTAAIGCVDCKGLMVEGLVRWIEPIRARRLEYESNPTKVSEILQEGSQKARKAARKTMRRVREAIFGGGRAQAGSGASVRARKQAAAGD